MTNVKLQHPIRSFLFSRKLILVYNDNRIPLKRLIMNIDVVYIENLLKN